MLQVIPAVAPRQQPAPAVESIRLVLVLRPEHSPRVLFALLVRQGLQVEVRRIAVQREFVAQAKMIRM